jgi:6-phosphogluconolactonase
VTALHSRTLADGREVVIVPSADALADEVASRVVSAVRAALDRRTRVALALTAGSIMESVWAALARADDAADVDWSRVDVFWGDERFVPHDSADRNDVPAERLLFGHEPFSSASRHSMPPSDGEYGDDLDAAAAGYAALLRGARRPNDAGDAGDADDAGDVPNFDLVLLGVGPDGHCCSLFPDHPSSRDLSATVIPVRDSPKPPPNRMSLSFDGLNAANEIWVVASGAGKADAVAAALAPNVDRTHVPSGGARARERTVWFVDSDASSRFRES